MKKMKKLMALVIAMVMCVGMMSLTAFAADDYTLTVNGTVKDHTYTAYQIFTGSKADKGQVSYGPLASEAAYDEDATYYVKSGADYVETTVVDAEDFAAKKATLYTRTGSSSLGDVVWGADITDKGKEALYTAYSITIPEKEGVKDYDAKIQDLLEAIAGGTGSESDRAVKFANVFFENTDADNGTNNAVTTVNAEYLQGPTGGKAIKATGTTVAFENLASGYYLVNDSYTPKEGEVNGIDYSIARIAVQVVGDTTINNKADKTTNKKTIKTADQLYNEKANELGIGRTVEYEVEETVPNYDGYKYYYFNMNDTLSTGLTFNNDIAVKVKIGVGEEGADEEGFKTLTAGTDYFVYLNDAIAGAEGKLYPAATALPSGDTHTFIIAFNNIMDYPVGAQIIANYSANVNSNAVTGIDPNKNEINTTFSNDPSKSDKGDKENYPGIPANTENHPVGTTPNSYTDTYTTKLTIHKVDEDGNPLPGVEFTLTGTSNDVVLKNEVVYELDPTGTYYMLKNGTYTETAPQNGPSLTPTTDNSGWVEIVAGDTYAGADIRVVGGKQYRPFVVETDKDKTHYIIVEGNADDYASTTLKYKPNTHIAADAAEEYSVVRVGTTDADGNIEFAQLGAGEYTLSETKVLPGYNDIEDIEFKITCTVPSEDTVIAGTEKCTWTVSDITPQGTVISEVMEGEEGKETGTGNFEITIENKKGTELPSTGGIGTTIFYVIGTILVLGAAVILIARRRVNAK